MILDALDPAQQHQFPCRVFDADGREIMFPVRIDTETGVVVKRAINRYGMMYEDVNAPRKWNGRRYTREAAVEVKRYRAPLTIKPGAATLKG